MGLAELERIKPSFHFESIDILGQVHVQERFVVEKFNEVVSLSWLARIQIKVLGKLIENLRITLEKVQVKEVLGTLKLIFL